MGCAWEFAAEAVNCEKFSTQSGFGQGEEIDLPDRDRICFGEKSGVISLKKS